MSNFFIFCSSVWLHFFNLMKKFWKKFFFVCHFDCWQNEIVCNCINKNIPHQSDIKNNIKLTAKSYWIKNPKKEKNSKQLQWLLKQWKSGHSLFFTKRAKNQTKTENTLQIKIKFNDASVCFIGKRGIKFVKEFTRKISLIYLKILKIAKSL